MSQQQLRVVITGGPCSGKTTLIEQLAGCGYCTVGECAIEIITELTAELGLEGQARWREREPARFQEMILERQRLRERAIPPSASLVFLDRGVHDGLAYLLHYGLSYTEAVRTSYGTCGYDHVVFLEPLGRFANRTETGRTETRDEALAIGDRIRSVYEECGVPILRLAEMPVQQRVARVLAEFGRVDGQRGGG